MRMARPTPTDELFVHQAPVLLDQVATRHDHWRESYFFEIHDPSGEGDAVFFTMARYPARGRMDSLQMGRVGGEQVLGYLDRADDADPHTTAVPGARVEVVRPWEEVRLWADPEAAAVGLDVVFRDRTQPYGLRRGTLWDGDDLIWDQCHILQSGTYTGSYTAGGVTREIDGWVGQRDHSWGVRDHGRCPLWLWFQIQIDDGFLFDHDVAWVGADGQPVAYGEHGETVAGVAGTATFALEDGRRITVEATGSFARPYEPFQRGGLNLMTVRTDDGRRGTAIYEVTGSRHRHFFPVP
jgi:hypothetical protein